MGNLSQVVVQQQMEGKRVARSPPKNLTKRQKTTPVTFSGRETHSITTSQSETSIYTDKDIERIRKLRKDKAESNAYSYFEKEPDAVQGDTLLFTPGKDEPKMEPFSMESDMKYGRFDEEGAFIFKRTPGRRGNDSDSEDSVSDPWLESIREEKESVTILEKRAQSLIQRQADEASKGVAEEDLSNKDTRSLLLELCQYLIPPTETPTQALKRLKDNAKIITEDINSKEKDSSKAVEGVDAEELDKEASRLRARWQRRKTPVVKKRMSPEDKNIFDRITALTDVLMIGKAIHTSTANIAQEQAIGDEEMLWQFRWRNSSDQAIYGPYTSTDLLSWVEAGYISDTTPVDLREIMPSGEPVDGVWRDWKSVRLEGRQMMTVEEDEARQEKESAIRKNEVEKRRRKEGELEESDDEEEICL